MKLVDLHPYFEFKDGVRAYLVFNCPTCPHPETDSLRAECQIVLPIPPSDNSWQIDGRAFETLTISPSIWHHCKTDPHFFITEGNIKIV